MKDEDIVIAKNNLLNQKIKKQKALKVPKISEPELKVGGQSSLDFLFNLETQYYNGSKSKEVRESLKNLIHKND